MIPAALDVLRRAEYFVDGRAQRFGSVDDEQISAVRLQTLIAQMREQAFHRSGVLGRATLDLQNVLAPFAIHAYSAQNVMPAEALAVDIDDQYFRGIPALFAQRLELLDARLDGLPAHRTARYARRFGHLRQHLVIFARRDAAQKRAQHVLLQAAILAQFFIRRDLHFAFGFVAQARTLHSHLAVSQLHAPLLRAVPANLAARLAGRASSGDLLGTHHENGLKCLDLNFVDHVLHHLTGAFDQLDDGQQHLPVGLAKLLDHGGRFLGSRVTIWYGFFTAVGVPS